jgi:hypothetical protein
VVPVYVAAQNAAIIFRRPRDDQPIITLESFEVYPPAEATTHTEGKLRIIYPSVGRLSMPVHPHARESVSQFVSFYARNPMQDAQSEENIRTQNTQDPPSPKYITELLTGIVRAMTINPEAMLAQTVYVSKRIDDHVLCERDSVAPWRRSPMWLIIRVALQTTLCEWNVEERVGYKPFVLYALSSIHHTALMQNKPDDLLFTMNAKLARRFCKCPDTQREGCFAKDIAATTNASVFNELEKRWKAIQRKTTRKVEWRVPTEEDLIDGACIDLFKAIPPLEDISRQEAGEQPDITESFVVPGGDHYATRKNADDLSPPDLANLPSAPLEQTIFLYDFEQWVAKQKPFSSIEILVLTRALLHYIRASLSHYKRNPERLSVAYLTITELWIAIDEKAAEWEPYLMTYSPEIPCDVLESLLLPRREQMQRLSSAELYLQTRHKVAHNGSAIFYDTTDSTSFANWFMGKSHSLQATLREMKEEAETKRREQEAAMERINGRYYELRRQIDAAVCTRRQVRTYSGWWHTEHLACDKCPKEDDLNALRSAIVLLFRIHLID